MRRLPLAVVAFAVVALAVGVVTPAALAQPAPPVDAGPPPDDVEPSSPEADAGPPAGGEAQPPADVGPPAEVDPPSQSGPQPPPGPAAQPTPPAPPPQVGPPPGPPGPPPAYVPPWLGDLGDSELRWRGGHLGYDLNNVKGLFHAGESWPTDRGFHVGFGPDDRFLLITNLSIALRFIDVHDDFFTEQRGRSFAVERMVLNFRGNFMSPRIVYMVNILALTGLGQAPFLLDTMLGFAIIPRKVALLVGQFPTDLEPQATTVTTNLQMGERSLATRFFFIDRSIGAQLVLNPMPPLTVALGAWNHTIEQTPFAYNQFNPDLHFMYSAGVDYNWGPPYGAREGDFNDSPVPRVRASVRGMYAEIDQPRNPPAVGLKGRILFGHAQVGAKLRGGSLMAGGFTRRSQFIDLAPDFFDAGAHVQGGYFMMKHFLEISARYSQIWPDLWFDDGRPRNLPERSPLQPKVDVLEPFLLPSQWEAGLSARLFPTEDPMFNLIAAYFLRDVDSAFMLQANGWL